MKTKITYAGKEIALKEIDKKPDVDRRKINNPTLDRAKRVYSFLRKEVSK